MGWFDKRKIWGKLPPEYFDDWLGNRIVASQSGDVVEFEDGCKLKLEFLGGGYWGDNSMTPYPTTIQWWFQQRTDEDTAKEEAIYAHWQQMAKEGSGATEGER